MDVKLKKSIFNIPSPSCNVPVPQQNSPKAWSYWHHAWQTGTLFLGLKDSASLLFIVAKYQNLCFRLTIKLFSWMYLACPCGKLQILVEQKVPILEQVLFSLLAPSKSRARQKWVFGSSHRPRSVRNKCKSCKLSVIASHDLIMMIRI